MTTNNPDPQPPPDFFPDIPRRLTDAEVAAGFAELHRFVAALPQATSSPVSDTP